MTCSASGTRNDPCCATLNGRGPESANAIAIDHWSGGQPIFHVTASATPNETASVERGIASAGRESGNAIGIASVELGIASVERGIASVEQGIASGIETGSASVGLEIASGIASAGQGTGNGNASVERGTASVEQATASAIVNANEIGCGYAVREIVGRANESASGCEIVIGSC